MKEKLPDWLTGDLLDAWNNYFAVRKSKRMMITARIIRGRMRQLEAFRTYLSIVDMVKVVDRAAEGTGKVPWLEFYLPKGYVRHEEKPVQERKPRIKTPEIKKFEKQWALMIKTGDFNEAKKIARQLDFLYKLSVPKIGDILKK